MESRDRDVAPLEDRGGVARQDPFVGHRVAASVISVRVLKEHSASTGASEYLASFCNSASTLPKSTMA